MSRIRTGRRAAAGERERRTSSVPDRHPYAGGPEHCAAYLENTDGFEVELVVGNA
ncbi:hypothetical protein GCM10010321_48460 [Streptomyces chartreusis]|nr:hypothetical protein GCM10010321_48460 [Streptomyces chartreusis]